MLFFKIISYSILQKTAVLVQKYIFPKVRYFNGTL